MLEKLQKLDVFRTIGAALSVFLVLLVHYQCATILSLLARFVGHSLENAHLNWSLFLIF